MNPGLKKFIIFSGVILILAISIATAIAYFNEEKIRALAVKQLNKLLSTEVSVKKIEFSLLKRFPNASIQFINIRIQESSNRKNKVDLLYAKSMFLEFDPFDLLTGNYVINEIYVTESNINIALFKDGSNNFQFLKGDEKDETFQISLEKVVLNESVINYHDAKNNIDIELETKKLTLSGDFESKEFDLKLSSTGTMSQFIFKDIAAKRTYPFVLDLVINIQRETDLYSIKKAKVELNDIPFNLTGKYQKFTDRSEMDFTFKSEKFTYKEVSSFLPEKTRKILTDYNVRGTLNLSGSFKGKLSERANPSINISYSIEKGIINHKKYNIEVDNIVLNGTYSNGKKNNKSTSEIIIEKVSFDGEYGNNQGSMSISNFDDPYLKFELNSILDLSTLIDLLKNDSIEYLEGKCKYSIQAETYLGSLNTIGIQDLKSAKASGNLNIHSGKIKWKGYKHSIENIEMQARFGNNLIYIDTLNYSLAGVYAELTGKLYNCLPYLFFENEKLMAQADLYYPDLNVNKIIEVDDNDDEKAGFFLPVSDMINLKLNLRADKFEINKFRAENISCNITSNYPYFIVRNLSLKAMEGSFAGWINFDLKNINNILCTSKLTLDQVNIHDLFYQFENFGQQSLIADNLQGYVNAKIEFHSELDNKLMVKSESVEVICHLEIKNGRLLNYKPILGLSKYIDVEELQDIKFSRLTNDIEIKNQIIYIPEMTIKTSALELVLSGKHSFDNEIDYHFKLWLNDFLFKKAKRSKKNKEEFGDVEVDDQGRAKLYLRMVGTIDDYKIKYDRRALRRKWKNDFNEERQELKELFHSEFSKDKKQVDIAPIKIGIEWEEFDQKPVVDDSHSNEINTPETPDKENKKKKKKSILEKLGDGVEDEYEEYDPDKFD